MKAIRRSIKGEKDTRVNHISITPKSAIAIVPPKKVIKALYDYEPDPRNTHELGFHKGDFFHVISREDDTEWYEACNPLIPSARGLVPVSFFEIIKKAERQSGSSVASGTSNVIMTPDSGYSERSGHARQESNTGAPVGTRSGGTGHARAISTGKGTGAMVYGMVLYDFSAERPDELEAKAGEAIIVIAQSNPEWFVAKPIGRLGGPGLIPVSFIEIRDMATNEPVSDPQAAVRMAGVPKVEEWKKMAAEYKNSSIALGKLESSNSQAQREIQRQSLNNVGNPTTEARSHSSYQQKTASRTTQDMDGTRPDTLMAPISATIPRYQFDNDKYWYVIECVMEDGRHWELSRYYQDFYDFQIALLAQFPAEAQASPNGPRVLPYMPGPVTYVTDAISNGRRESLDDYVKKLLALPPYISKCQLVRELFAPRQGDYELDPRRAGEDFRLSSASQQSSGQGDLSRTASRQSSQGQMNGNGYPPGSMGPPAQRMSHQRSQQSMPGQNGVAPSQAYRGPAEYQSQAAINRQPSSLTQASSNSGGQYQNPGPISGPPPSGSATSVAVTGALKIKVNFEDDLIAIRVPSEINFQQLRDKLKDRLRIQDDIVIQFRDEPTGNHAELTNDRDLDLALSRNPKLTLYVGYA